MPFSTSYSRILYNLIGQLLGVVFIPERRMAPKLRPAPCNTPRHRVVLDHLRVINVEQSLKWGVPGRACAKNGPTTIFLFVRRAPKPKTIFIPSPSRPQA